MKLLRTLFRLTFAVVVTFTLLILTGFAIWLEGPLTDLLLGDPDIAFAYFAWMGTMVFFQLWISARFLFSKEGSEEFRRFLAGVARLIRYAGALLALAVLHYTPAGKVLSLVSGELWGGSAGFSVLILSYSVRLGWVAFFTWQKLDRLSVLTEAERAAGYSLPGPLIRHRTGVFLGESLRTVAATLATCPLLLAGNLPAIVVALYWLMAYIAMNFLFPGMIRRLQLVT